jgi:hypothetical protein
VLYYKLVCRFQHESRISDAYAKFFPTHDDQLLFVTEEKVERTDEYRFYPIKSCDIDERVGKDVKGKKAKPTNGEEIQSLEVQIENLYIFIQLKYRALNCMALLPSLQYEAYGSTVNAILKAIEAAIDIGITGIEQVKRHNYLVQKTWELYFPTPSKQKKKRKSDGPDPGSNNNHFADHNTDQHNGGNNGPPNEPHSDASGSDPGAFFGFQGGFTAGCCGGNRHASINHGCNGSETDESDDGDENSKENSLPSWHYMSNNDDESEKEGMDNEDEDYNVGGGKTKMECGNKSQTTGKEILDGDNTNDSIIICSKLTENIQLHPADEPTASAGKQFDAQLELFQVRPTTQSTSTCTTGKSLSWSQGSLQQTQQQQYCTKHRLFGKKKKLQIKSVELLQHQEIAENTLPSRDSKQRRAKKWLIPFLKKRKSARLHGNPDIVIEDTKSSPARSTISTTNSEVSHDDRSKSIKLVFAARSGNLEMVKEVVTEGFNIEVGKVALHFASDGGHLDIVQYLIEECHVDKDVRDDDYGSAAQHFASASGHIEILRYLIETCHADKNAKDDDGCTALHYASAKGYMDIVKYLIEACHVDKDAKDNNGYSAIHYAVDSSNKEIMRYLLELE